jgi:hypothetical protein
MATSAGSYSYKCIVSLSAITRGAAGQLTGTGGRFRPFAA